MADIVLMRFPIRNVTYSSVDGTPYRTDAQGIVGVAARHVAQAEGVGAVRVEPEDSNRSETAAAAVTDAAPQPKRTSTSKKPART